MNQAEQKTLSALSDLGVDTDPARLAAFIQDADGSDGATPLAIVRPKNLYDIEKLLNWANESGTGVIPASSTGRRRRGDTVPARGNVVIADLTGMNHVLNVDGRDKMAIIEPGVAYGAIDALLKPHGLRANRPLGVRAGKSVIASYLEREPLINPHDHWDVADPFGGTVIVYGDGNVVPTGGAAIEGTLEQQLKRGHRHIFSVTPGAIDPLRLLQGAQGSLGIMAWAAIICERIPAIEKSWFASADKPGPVINLARELLHRRLGSALFLLDATSLALMLADSAASFEALKTQLPQWNLFVSLSAASQAPEVKMAWQTADLEAAASQFGVQLNGALGGVEADQFARQIRQSEDVCTFDRALGDHRALFFLSQLDKVDVLCEIVRATLAQHGFQDVPLGTYVQPMVQGVFAHVEFTVPHGDLAPDRKAALEAALLNAAQACADAGGFFSRPYGAWADIAFGRDPALLPILKAAKSIVDPAGVMNPGRLPY